MQTGNAARVCLARVRVRSLVLSVRTRPIEHSSGQLSIPGSMSRALPGCPGLSLRILRPRSPLAASTTSFPDFMTSNADFARAKEPAFNANFLNVVPPTMFPVVFATACALSKYSSSYHTICVCCWLVMMGFRPLLASPVHGLCASGCAKARTMKTTCSSIIIAPSTAPWRTPLQTTTERAARSNRNVLSSALVVARRTK
jgi:hypothetical protein